MSTAQTQHKVQCRFLLDVVVAQGAAILQLLTSKDQALLVRGNALLVLDLGLDVVNCVRRLDFEGDGFACQGLHKDLHFRWRNAKVKPVLCGPCFMHCGSVANRGENSAERKFLYASKK